MNNMSFGEAIEAIKAGKSVRRKNWNGKNMYIYLRGTFHISGQMYEPVICIFTTQSKHQPGWLASQEDILANDWEIVVFI